jgi:hypothetical protein
MRKLLLGLAILGLSLPAFAVTRFVTQAGAGSNNGTSLGNAWSVATFHTITTLTGGDTVFFSGTITSTVSPASSGTSSGSQLTLDFTGAVLTPPCFTANGQNHLHVLGSSLNPIATDTGGNNLFVLGASTDIIIDGFTFTGGSGNNGTDDFVQFSNGASNLTLQNNTVDNIESFMLGATGGAVSNIIVQNNFARTSTNTLDQTDVLFIEDAVNVTIQGNKFIQQAPGATSVRHNDVIQTFRSGSGAAQNPSNWIVRYNWIELDVTGGSGDNSWMMMENMAGTPAMQAYGNVFTGDGPALSGGNGIVWHSGTNASDTYFFYNNTVYRHTQPVNAIRLGIGDGPGTLFSENNIGGSAATCSCTLLQWQFTAGAPWDYNFFDTTWSSDTCSSTFTGTHGACNQTIGFVNASADNYALSGTSPLINGGDSTIGASYNQGLAPTATWPNPALTSRSSGHWDAGAFQTPTATGSIGILTPTAGINLNTTGNIVQVYGISGTSWTPGTPGSPTFTISGGSCTGIAITGQTVVSSGLVDLTITSSSTACTATITDPSTSATVNLTVRSSPLNWYVNSSTGGTRYSPFNLTGQCNGQASTAYVSGVNQNCPFSDGRLLWDDNNLSLSDQRWTLAGSDTAIFQTNTQISGSDNITPGTGFCAGIGGQCVPPDVPSGTASVPTVFEGANFAACSGAKNFLESIYLQNVGDPAKQVVLTAESTLGTRPFYGLGLAASQHTILRCIDLIGNGGSTTEGIFLGGNVTPLNFDNTLQDFTIEGFLDAGIRGNIGGTGPSIHFTRTTFQFNGQSGFNADPGTAAPGTFQLSTGDIVASYPSFFANGCQMEFPVVHTLFPATGCKDDNSPGGGGYGDCFGSQSTTLNATWDHALAAFCTQDGIDGLHGLNGRTSITNSQAWGSMGATLKAGPGISATYTNNVFIANCHRMSDPIGGNSTYNTALSDWCRASSQNAMVALPTAVEITGGIESTGTAVVQAGATATHFTTELHIGDTVAVGTFNAVSGKRTITNIADDTHLTINAGFPSDVTIPTNLLFLPGGTSVSNSTLTVEHGTFIGYGGTVWDVPCQTGLNIAGVPGQEGVDTSFCAGVTFIYKNNIAQGWGSPNYSAAQMWDALLPTVEDYNLFFGLNTTYGTGAHDLNANTLFVSQPASPITAESQLDNFNFSLSGTSPAKAAGIPISGITTDFLGVPYNGSTPSMGALQFASPASVTMFGGKIIFGNTKTNP